MVWFPGVSGFGFRGVSGVCFGVAQDGVLLGGGFWRFWVCFLFWFVRTWGWGFRGCAGFCGVRLYSTARRFVECFGCGFITHAPPSRSLSRRLETAGEVIKRIRV